MRRNILSAAVLLSCVINLNSITEARSILYTEDMSEPSATVVSTQKSTDKIALDSNGPKDKKELKKINKELKKDSKKSTDTFKIDNKNVSKKDFDKKKYMKKDKKKSGKEKSESTKPVVDKPAVTKPAQNPSRPVYEVIDGKTYLKGTELPENYKEIKIMGEAVGTKAQALAFLLDNNPDPKLFCSPEKIVDIYWDEATLEGVRPDLAFCQALLETGFFAYGGDVIPTQNNFCGLGTTGGGVKGAFFKTPELGARAHIQHLLAYARIVPPRTEIIDPRYNLVHGIRKERGLIGNWSGLNGTWAMGSHYAEKIFAHYQNMLAMTVTEKEEEKPQIIEETENHEVRKRINKILKEKK